MSRISIIVPIYNAQASIDRCIKSILNQSFGDFEVLLVDDGSTDRTFKICQQYAEMDSRISFYHKNNGGVSSARNLGLREAKGEWITFVDSDDTINEHYLKHLYESASEEVSLVMSYPVLIYSDGRRFTPIYESNVYDKATFNNIFTNSELHKFTSPWAKLYKQSIINKYNIRFCEEMHIGEDMVFLFTYLQYTSKIVVLNQADYHYTFEQQNSLTKRVNSFESEYVGYLNVKNAIDQLITIWSISSTRSLHSLAWIRGYYVRRVLNAIYNFDRLNRYKRLEIIRQLDLASYYEELHIPAFKEKLLATLLKFNLLYIYDTLRMVSKKIR